MLRNAILVSFGLALFAYSATSTAGNKAEAKKHFENGLALLKSENIEAAAVEFETAVKIYPTKGGMFNLANCYKTLGRYDEALNTLELMRGEFGGQLDAEYRAVVAGLENEIKALVAFLMVEVAERGAKILIDDKQVGITPLGKPLMVGPGVHQLTIDLEGYKPVRRKLKLSSGDEVAVRFELEPLGMPATEKAGAAGPSGDGLSPLFWVGLAGTVAVGAVSGVFWGLRSNKADDYERYRGEYLGLDGSGEPVDPATEQALWGEMTDARDEAQTFEKVAIGTTVAASALAAGTLIVLIVNLSDAEDAEGHAAAWRVVPAPGGVGVTF